MKTKHIALWSCLCIVALLACKKPLHPDVQNYSAEPNLPSTPYNYANSSNDELATLGRVLFYDKKLSLNNSIACASCHQQNKAFCDNMQFSKGLEDKFTSRNSPSIFAKSGRMFWDGRAADINDLVLKPVMNHVEMGIVNMDALVERLRNVSYYPALFNKAYGSSEITASGVQGALAEFVRNFNFSGNKFNGVMNGIEQFTALEQQGSNLFNGKAMCATCHHVNNGGNGYGFTDEDHNIGLDETYSDNGIGARTGKAEDYGKFMMPALLNVEFTAPYMHDGRFKTLEEVVEHYNSGIKAHPNLDVRLRSEFLNMSESQIISQLDVNHNGKIDSNEMPANSTPAKLNLSTQEKQALVAFLKTLSDKGIFTDVRFSDPFVKK